MPPETLPAGQREAALRPAGRVLRGRPGWCAPTEVSRRRAGRGFLSDVPERHLLTNRKAPRTAIGRTCRELRLAVGADARRLRVDAGLSQRRLATLAEVDHGFLSLVERGQREPSLAVLNAIAQALGGNVSVRLYPGTGPRLSDPIQSRITEAIIGILHARWTRLLEVPVYRPVRGVIDLVAHDQSSGVVLAIEVQSQLRRLEQHIRWMNEKAAALPSPQFWQFADPRPAVHQVLVLRSTRANRALASRFADTLGTAYPASTAAAYEALTTGDAAWPGSVLIWASLDGDRVRLLERPPRGVDLGR